MRESSHAAARAVRRGGLPNAIFLAESAERLPGALIGRADIVTVVLPWGSLLHGLLCADPDLLGRIAAVLKPGGELELLLSTQQSDGLAVQLRDQAQAERLAAAYAEPGLNTIECRPATAADVARLSSAWGRRLGIPERRTGWIFRFAKGCL
jgi:16S rRNA (adenine(1408)-N(1))-methyltransferase